MRIVIAGAGKVGRSIARELSANGHDVVMLDRDPEAAANYIEGVRIQQSDACEIASLEAVGLDGSQVVIAATGRGFGEDWFGGIDVAIGSGAEDRFMGFGAPLLGFDDGLTFAGDFATDPAILPALEKPDHAERRRFEQRADALGSGDP